MSRRGRNIRYQLGSRRRIITVWGLGAVFAIYYFIRKFTGLSSVNDYQNFASDALNIIVVLCVCSVPFVFWWILSVRRKNLAESNKEHSFRDNPWMFDKEFVKFYGKVEKTFDNDPAIVMKRRLVNLFRKLTASQDHTGRHVHQRFLVSSPLLRGGENIMVLANLDAKTPKVREGAWVSLQGEYIHSRSRQNSKWGKPLTYYGKVHYTHPPLGYLTILPGKPKDPMEAVEIVPEVKREYLAKSRRREKERGDGK